MTKRKNDGNNEGDDLITFTPTVGFDIRKAAGDLAKLMEETGHPLVIRLSHVAVEFEPGCTRKEIIDGYHRAMKVSMSSEPANANVNN